MKLVKIYLAHWALGSAVAIETPETINMPVLKGEKSSQVLLLWHTHQALKHNVGKKKILIFWKKLRLCEHCIAGHV